MILFRRLSLHGGDLTRGGGFKYFHLIFGSVYVPLGFLDADGSHSFIAILDRGFYFCHGGFRHTCEVLVGDGEGLGRFC